MPDPIKKHSPAIVAVILVISLTTSLAPVRSLEHTVAPGDALSTIATTYEVTVDQIVSANNLGDPNLIIAGHTLTIPEDVSETLAMPTTHTVVVGDSLWALAARYRVGLGALARLNGIGPDALIILGQDLELPIPSSAGAEALGTGSTQDTQAGPAPETSPPSQLRQTHIVKSGETLWAIAARYSVGLDELLDANGLGRGTIINVGQNLRLPQDLVIDTSDLPADLSADPVRQQLMPVFDYWANEYSVPPDLLKALAWFESGWNNEKRSSASAIGIGQLLPITADFVGETLIGEALDPTVPDDNIRMSARYLRYLLDHTGDVRLAIASYYQGLTATRQHGIYRSSVFYVDGIVALRSQFK